MEIPQQLKQKGIKFVLLEKGGKKPFQKEWQNKSIYFDDIELKQHIDLGGNYGVMGGGEKKLVIIDFDNERIQEEICNKLPITFTIKTGSGKLHKYFFSDNCESFKIFDEEMNTLADVQGEGKQVVGANSIHPNGNKYELIDNSDISFMFYSEIKALLIPHDKKPKKEKKEYEKPRVDLTNDFLDKLKSVISMESVLNSFGINTSKNPTECTFHSSKGGKCLGFNYETAHCFHCDGSWNIFSFVKEMKKCDFKESLVYLSNLSGMQDELEKSKRKYIDSLKEKERDVKRELKHEFLELISGKEKKWSQATELLVDYIKQNLYLYTTKDDIKSEMWTYKEGIYIPQGRSEIKIILRDILKEWYSQYIVNLVIAKLEADTFIESEKFFINKYKEEIAVQNGILNIYSRDLKSFTPEKIFFNKLNVIYEPTAKCLMIHQFLNDILSKERDKQIFFEWGGFNLTNDYIYEKALMCVGDGRNGKDKMLELLKRTLGVENCCSVPLASLVPDSFVISELFGKKSNLAGDISNQDLKDLSMFKALTGRSLISAKRKFLKDITFVNSAKFTFACNELPMVYELNRGFWDRWILLEFPYTFLTKQEYEKAEDKRLLKLRDENIIEKITQPEELSGLLNEFLDGLDDLCLFKDFSSTDSSEEIKKKWIRKSNSFIAFCMDKLEEDYGSKISKKDLRKEYFKFCKKYKVISKSDVVIKRVLQDNYGANEGQEFLEFGNVRDRYWEGIKWK
jgi:putative DNA primase/helicase